MNNITQDVKDFPTWARETCAKHADILNQMRKSLDPLDRAIAARIMKIIGEVKE